MFKIPICLDDATKQGIDITESGSKYAVSDGEVAACNEYVGCNPVHCSTAQCTAIRNRIGDFLKKYGPKE